MIASKWLSITPISPLLCQSIAIEASINRIWPLVGLRIGYLILAGFLLLLLRSFIFNPRFSGRQWRFRVIFPHFNFGLLIGFLAVMLEYPIWTSLRLRFPSLTSLLLEDTLNLFLLLLYLFVFLYNLFLITYDMARPRMDSFKTAFGSYLKQNVYRWILLLNIIIFLRMNYFYLPLISEDLSGFNQVLIEILVAVGFLLLQLLVFYFRKLNMVEASPELKALTREIADQLGVKINIIRVWRLDGVCNAFATGIFRKSIFITERLLNTAALDDLKMIIGHECAHFKQHHLVIRVFFIAVALSGGTFIMEAYPKVHWVLYAIFSLAGLLIYKAISRYQELQADKLAAKALGGGLKMAIALARVFGSGSRYHNTKWGFIFKLLAGHPEPGVRNERLLENANK